MLRELIAGGAPGKLRADRAAALLGTVHPLTAGDRARKQVAWDLVAEVRGLDRRLAAIGNRIQDTVAALGSRLPETVGVGPVIAGRLLGRTGRASRFPPPAHLASDTGAAPVEVASGERARHRLSRAGDRQRNHALHIIALVQIALVQVGTPGWAGDHDFRRKLAEGKTTREAMRRRKRRVADHVWRVMLSDEQARNHHQPQTADRQRRPRPVSVNTATTPNASSVDCASQPEHAAVVPTAGLGRPRLEPSARLRCSRSEEAPCVPDA